MPAQVMHLNLFRNLKKQCLTYGPFLKFFSKAVKNLHKNYTWGQKFWPNDKTSEKAISSQSQESCKNKMTKFASICRFSLPRICWTSPYSLSIKDPQSGPVVKGLLKKEIFQSFSEHYIFWSLCCHICLIWLKHFSLVI